MGTREKMEKNGGTGGGTDGENWGWIVEAGCGGEGGEGRG